MKCPNCNNPRVKKVGHHGRFTILKCPRSGCNKLIYTVWRT